MKKARMFLYSVILSMFVCAAVSAQKDLPPLAPDASLADTQAWLLKVIGKNSTYHIDLTKKSLTDIKFDGCGISYTMRSDTQTMENGALPKDSNEDASDLSSKASGDGDIEESLGSNGSATIKFSFIDMNPATLALVNAKDSNKVKGIFMESLGGKNAVSIGTKTRRGNRSAERPSLVMIVKEAVAEQVKNGLAQAMKLCQAPK